MIVGFKLEKFKETRRLFIFRPKLLCVWFYSGYRHQSVGETMGVEGTGTLFLPIENSDAEQVYRTPTPGLTDFT